MDYKETLHMPKTAFEMRGNLTKKEPGFQKRWQDEKLYEKMLERREGAESFVLHDGPPYANGEIHMGHALNKVLKDSLKLLHPVMPFVTEKIYMQLYHNDESIMISKWPEYTESLSFEKEEEQVEKLKTIIVGIRNLRTNLNVHPSKKSKLIFVTKTANDMLKE